MLELTFFTWRNDVRTHRSLVDEEIPGFLTDIINTQGSQLKITPLTLFVQPTIFYEVQNAVIFDFIPGYYSEGIPSEESLLSLYCQLSGETLPLPDWTFFLGLTLFRVIVNIQVGVRKKKQIEETDVFFTKDDPQEMLTATRGNHSFHSLTLGIWKQLWSEKWYLKVLLCDLRSSLIVSTEHVSIRDTCPLAALFS